MIPIYRLVRMILSGSLLLALTACQCIQAPQNLSDYSFSVYHSRSVVAYQPEPQPGMVDDVIYIYLSIQNDSPERCGLCFAYWSGERNTWEWKPFANLIPEISVDTRNAPVIGAAEVRQSGLSGRTITPGERFPAILADSRDFPLNEANYRRDVAIALRPDHSKTGQSGSIDIQVALRHLRSDGGDEKPSPVAHFLVPVTISDQFRPEGITVEPAELSK